MKRVSGDILGSLVDPGMRRTLEVGIRIQRAWEGALGESLARVLRPGLLAGGRLKVQVTSSAWLMEARFLEPRLLRALQEALPDLVLQAIEFELAPREFLREPRELPRGLGKVFRRELEEEDRERIRALVEGIRDPELKEGLRRFFEKLAVRTAPEDDKERDE